MIIWLSRELLRVLLDDLEEEEEEEQRKRRRFTCELFDNGSTYVGS